MPTMVNSHYGTAWILGKFALQVMIAVVVMGLLEVVN